MEQRVLITYDGQPITCYGCNETGHQYGDCPHRRTVPLSPQQTTHTNSWAKILINGPRTEQQDEEKRERREEKGAPLDAHKTDTKKTPENEQKQKRQVPKQTTTKEATQEVDGNRATAETYVPTETTGIGGEKNSMQGEEREKRKERENRRPWCNTHRTSNGNHPLIARTVTPTYRQTTNQWHRRVWKPPSLTKRYIPPHQ